MKKKLFTKKNIVTLPNLLSLIRLAMIPFICYAYFKMQDYVATAILIAASALTDIVDGIIARKFNMVSDLGKMLDPFADKLTEGVLILALSIDYPFLIPIVVLFALFEISKAILGWIVVKKTGVMRSAKWFGKLNTVYLYETILVMIVFKDASPIVFNVFIIKSAVAFVLMTTSFVMYVVAYSKALKEVRLNKQRAESENAVAQREENAEQDESEGENVGQAAVGREE